MTINFDNLRKRLVRNYSFIVQELNKGTHPSKLDAQFENMRELIVLLNCIYDDKADDFNVIDMHVEEFKPKGEK